MANLDKLDFEHGSESWSVYVPGWARGEYFNLEGEVLLPEGYEAAWWVMQDHFRHAERVGFEPPKFPFLNPMIVNLPTGLEVMLFAVEPKLKRNFWRFLPWVEEYSPVLSAAWPGHKDSPLDYIFDLRAVQVVFDEPLGNIFQGLKPSDIEFCPGNEAQGKLLSSYVWSPTHGVYYIGELSESTERQVGVYQSLGLI
ncbi:MAG: hypothetical protein ABIG95_00720 [Candidatus Woesearchaeota archaeon]